jgi:hypothetical protein
MAVLKMVIVLASRRSSKLTQKVSYPSIISFEGQLASGLQAICDLFEVFIGPDLVNDEPLFESVHITVSEVDEALLELDSSKGPGLDSVPKLILNNCAFAFRLCMLFNRSIIGNVCLPR